MHCRGDVSIRMKNKINIIFPNFEAPKKVGAGVVRGEQPHDGKSINTSITRLVSI